MTFTDGVLSLIEQELAGTLLADPDPPKLTASGRWDVKAGVGIDQTKAKQADLTLRLDPMRRRQRMISGDVRVDLNPPGPRLKLGGRTDWAFSFVAALDAARSIDRQLIVPCDLTASLGGGSAEDHFKGTVHLGVGPQGSLDRFALTVLAQVPGGWTFANNVVAENLPKPAPLRRRIRVYVAVTQEVRDRPGCRDALAILLNRRHELGLVRALKAADIEADLDTTFAREPPRGLEHELGLEQNVKADQYDDYVSRLVPSIGARTRHLDLGDNDWSHTLVFAANDGDTDRLNYGEAYGLGSELSRFNSRNGAVVNVTALKLDAEDAPPFPDDAKRDAKRLAWTIRFTAIHELAHLLNLPHAWERARGHRMLGPSRADSLSWTNYPTRHPFGASAAAHFDSVRGQHDPLIGDVPKADVLRQRRRAFSRVFRGRFDPVERHFIRHAPLPHIAQGGWTFLDSALPPPRFTSASTGSAGLAIMAMTDHGLKPLSRMELWTWSVESDGAITHQFPVVPAWIVLTEYGEPVRKTAANFDFRLDSGAVQIVLAPAPQGDPALARTVISYHADGLAEPSTRMLTDSQCGRAPSGTAYLHDTHVAVLLPWITRGALFRQLSPVPVPDEVIVQAVYFRGARKLRSAPVTLSFRGVRPLGRVVAAGDLDSREDLFFAGEAAPPPIVVPADEPTALDPGGHPSTAGPAGR